MNVYKRIQDRFEDFDNWRYLKNIKPKYTNTFDGMINRIKLLNKSLTVLLETYYTVTFPNIEIIEFLNMNEFPRGLMVDEYPSPDNCIACNGAGKFDWVSIMTAPSYKHSRYEFIRDKSMVLIYESDGQFSKNNIWASTEVCPGERICDDCLGTGIDLKHHGFNLYGIVDLKNKLIPCDIRYFL